MPAILLANPIGHRLPALYRPPKDDDKDLGEKPVFQKFAAAILAAGILAAPALAQKAPAQILLLQENVPAPAPYTVVGEVSAEAHVKSLAPKVSARDLADAQLRDQAARLGADAVVNIKYEDNNPMLSKKGFHAKGQAVKFNFAQAAQAQAQPAPVQSAPAPSYPPPIPVIPLQTQTPPPIATPPVQAIPVPPPPMLLSEADLSRAYTVLGPISSGAPTRAAIEEGLRAQAKALGADAVIFVKYSGASAMGVAVKYK